MVIIYFNLCNKLIYGSIIIDTCLIDSCVLNRYLGQVASVTFLGRNIYLLLHWSISLPMSIDDYITFHISYNCLAIASISSTCFRIGCHSLGICYRLYRWRCYQLHLYPYHPQLIPWWYYLRWVRMYQIPIGIRIK